MNDNKSTWSSELGDEITARNSDVESMIWHDMANLADNLTTFNGSVISPSCLIMHVALL